MSTNKTAQAGSMESNDILIRLAAHDGPENIINVKSIVIKQFGAAIEATIRECLAEYKLGSVRVDADDRGALECTIRARMEAAIMRWI